MVIYLPAQSVDEEPILDELTPREIVRELDKHVVGQAAAKRAVAIALRNRIRRQKLPPEMAEEVMPKNILMIDRKSTRLNSSHLGISYAVFCLDQKSTRL